MGAIKKRSQEFIKKLEERKKNENNKKRNRISENNYKKKVTKNLTREDVSGGRLCLYLQIFKIFKKSLRF